MQDEIVARLAGALNAQLVVAEARRAEQAPNPNSMGHYFQGLTWLKKGLTPDNLAQARSFFDRALSVDPGNVDALVGSAVADVREGANSFVTDPSAAFAAAEAKLTKALWSVPDHARGHMWLGLVDMWTKRAAQGVAECEHALVLDRDPQSECGARARGRLPRCRRAQRRIKTTGCPHRLRKQRRVSAPANRVILAFVVVGATNEAPILRHRSALLVGATTQPVM